MDQQDTTVCCPRCGKCETWVFCEVIEGGKNEPYNKTIFACNNDDCKLQFVHFYWTNPNYVEPVEPTQGDQYAGASDLSDPGTY